MWQHLYSCDLDGKELRTVSDCMERLKLLEEMGRVWGQNMLLEVRGLDLLLTDTETKVDNDKKKKKLHSLMIFFSWWGSRDL